MTTANANGDRRIALTARIKTGRRTTASMHESVRDTYIENMGGTVVFRDKFNQAMREVIPVKGLTRSMGVRLVLDRHVADLKAAKEAAPVIPTPRSQIRL